MARKKRFDKLLTLLISNEMHNRLINVSKKDKNLTMSDIVRLAITKEIERRERN